MNVMALLWHPQLSPSLNAAECTLSSVTGPWKRCHDDSFLITVGMWLLSTWNGLVSRSDLLAKGRLQADRDPVGLCDLVPLQHHAQAGCSEPGCRLRPHSCDAAVVFITGFL